MNCWTEKLNDRDAAEHACYYCQSSGDQEQDGIEEKVVPASANAVSVQDQISNRDNRKEGSAKEQQIPSPIIGFTECGPAFRNGQLGRNRCKNQGENPKR